MTNFPIPLIKRLKPALASATPPPSSRTQAYVNVGTQAFTNQRGEFEANLPIANQGIDPMITRTKAPQLDLLPILNLLRIAIAPLQRHLTIRIGVHEHVERAVAIQHRQEGHGCGDLSEDGLDLVLDLFFGFFDRGGFLFFSGACLVSVICRVGLLGRRTRGPRSLYPPSFWSSCSSRLGWICAPAAFVSHGWVGGG